MVASASGCIGADSPFAVEFLVLPLRSHRRVTRFLGALVVSDLPQRLGGEVLRDLRHGADRYLGSAEGGDSVSTAPASMRLRPRVRYGFLVYDGDFATGLIDVLANAAGSRTALP